MSLQLAAAEHTDIQHTDIHGHVSKGYEPMRNALSSIQA
jgi:hypothetical protein